MSQYEFGSPDWVEAVHNIVKELLASERLDGIDFSLSERFDNPPEHLAKYAPLGWHLIVRDGQLQLGHGPLEKADRMNIADYQAVLPLAIIDLEKEPDKLEMFQEMAGKLLADGKIRSNGSPSSSVFPSLAQLHDRIARITRSNGSFRD